MKNRNLFVIIYFVFVNFIYSDIITLKNGKVIEGKILNQTRTGVQIQLEDGKVIQIGKEEIQKIQFGLTKREIEEKKKIEEQRKKEEEKKRLEEQRRIEEEKRKEEEQKKLEEEKRKLEKQQNERTSQEPFSKKNEFRFGYGIGTVGLNFYLSHLNKIFAMTLKNFSMFTISTRLRNDNTSYFLPYWIGNDNLKSGYSVLFLENSLNRFFRIGVEYSIYSIKPNGNFFGVIDYNPVSNIPILTSGGGSGTLEHLLLWFSFNLLKDIKLKFGIREERISINLNNSPYLIVDIQDKIEISAESWNEDIKTKNQISILVGPEWEKKINRNYQISFGIFGLAGIHSFSQDFQWISRYRNILGPVGILNYSAIWNVSKTGILYKIKGYYWFDDKGGLYFQLNSSIIHNRVLTNSYKISGIVGSMIIPPIDIPGLLGNDLVWLILGTNNRNFNEKFYGLEFGFVFPYFY